MSAASWFRVHLASSHIVAPVWLRVPETWRWKIVHRLDRSRKRCWSDLVDAALAQPEADACDVRTPLGCDASNCSTTCYFVGGAFHGDHIGQHACSCYCGKFQFTAATGADDRREVTP